ncbi:MAG: S-layer homology domain-containing protein [Clostridiales bacterium]|nr:S-layer homology domain-containing protein [Clostridiales bacterium]
MKMKLFSIIVTVICVFALWPISHAIAADMPTVYIRNSGIEVISGTTVTVTLAIKDNTGIAGLQLQIGYDAQVLKLISQNNVTKGTELGLLQFVGVSADTYQNNPFKISWAGAANDSSNGDILNVEFTVLPNAKAGSSLITVDYVPTNTRTADGELANLNTVNGSVIVKGGNDDDGKGKGDGKGDGNGEGSVSSGGDVTITPPVVIAEPDPPLATFSGFAAFIQGFEDNTFRGDSLMTREQFVAILFRLKNPQFSANKSNPSFNDVAPARWSYEAIEWAKSADIITANALGNFSPAEPLTRADMAIMLVKADKLTEMAENSFNDLAGHADRDDILKAVKAGIFVGYPDGTFKPEGNTIRNEAVTALIRYLLGGEPSDEMWRNLNITFSDVSTGAWAYKYIALAVKGYTRS